MKLSQAKEYLPLVQAAAEGKTIQWTNNGGISWSDYDPCRHYCDFHNPANEYRIKPTPKLRPWKPEEVPVGAWYRDNKVKIPTVILTAHNGRVFFASWSNTSGDVDWDYLSAALREREYSTENGKTWFPCGVEE